MFEALWKAGLAEYDDFEGIAWRWQSIDGAMMKAPWHSQALAPIQRTGGKNGSKRHLLVDGRGVPLSLVVTGANRHDVSQWKAVLDALMIKRSLPPQRRSPRLGGGPYVFTSEIERIAPKGLFDGDFPEAQDAEPYPISAVGYSLDDIRGQTLGLEEKIA